jgi:hypothetical protein
LDQFSGVRSSLATCRPAPIGGGTRLIAVLEDATEAALLASRILELAQRQSLGILLLGVAPDPSGVSELRRQLVTIAAFIRQEQARMGLAGSRGVPAHSLEIQIEIGRDWLRGIKDELQPGDTVACSSAQVVGMLGRPLTDVLASNLNVPIYAFAGLERPRGNPQHALSQVAAWVCSLASIGGFLFLQARMVTYVQGWPQSALLLLTLGMEVASIWFLNSLFGTF